MKKTSFALITWTLTFAVQAAPIEIPEQFVGSYAAKGEKCDRKTNGKFKTKGWLIVTKRTVEMNSIDYEANDGSWLSIVCSPIKAVKVMGDSGTFQSRCEGGPVGTYRLTKLPNGIGHTHVSDVGAPMYSYTACPSK
jgi:hypothetical protein